MYIVIFVFKLPAFCARQVVRFFTEFRRNTLGMYASLEGSSTFTPEINHSTFLWSEVLVSFYDFNKTIFKFQYQI